MDATDLGLRGGPSNPTAPQHPNHPPPPPPAPRAHGSVHLALARATAGADPQGPVLLRHRATTLAALRLVDQALLGVELLFAGREHEVHAAVAATDRLVRVHPTLTSLQRTTGPDMDGAVPSGLG